MSNLYSQFVDFIEDENLIEPTNSILVGVSGGVDSMTLLDLLLRYKQKKGVSKLRVAHFNHSTREGESDLDEKLVRNYCQKNELPCHVKKVDIPRLAQKSKKSFEMVARERRQAYFDELSNKRELIATAHTLDDHIETILLRTIKGAGLKGLSGISSHYKNRIKPLLFAQKKDIYQWAQDQKVPFREDKTNYENHCLRNTIRNKLIPIIEEEINPGYVQSIQRVGNIAKETDEYLTRKASRVSKTLINTQKNWYYSIDCKKLSEKDDILIKYILMYLARQLFPGAVVGHIELNRFLQQVKSKNTGQKLELTNCIRAEFNRSQVIIYNKHKQNWSITNLSPGENIETDTFKIVTEKMGRDKVQFNTDSDIEYIDSEKIGRNLKVRHWQSGDVFIPFGLDHSKKISDYFIDNKVPNYLKHNIPLIVHEEEIVWVCGERLSHNYRVTKDTNQVLKMQYIEK